MSQRKLTRKTPTTERKKYCHCTPFCNKKLTRQARRRHYKRLQPEQLDAVQESAALDYSSYSSYSEKFLSDSDSDVLEAPTIASSSNFARPSGSSSDETIHQSRVTGSPDGSVEDEDSQRELVESNEPGYTGDRAVPGQDDKEHFKRGNGEESEGEGSSGQSASEREGLEHDISSDQGSDFDEWRDYNEDDETAALQSDEERLHEFEDILGPEEHAELWESRL